MLPSLRWVFGLALSLGGGAPDTLPWDGQTYRTYADPAAHLAFPIPLTQTRVEARHFGTTASATQMTDVFTLSGPTGAELEIGVWSNPGQVAPRCL